MRRRDGLLVVAGMWAFIAAWVSLFIWPLWAAIGWLVGLFAITLFAALFVWPHNEDGRENQ